MADVTALANAIATTLTAGGIRSTAYLADSFSVPCALVGIKESNFHEAFGGYATFDFTVTLLVARPSDRAGIEAIEAYMSSTGTSSIMAILEADGTLGGVADNTIVKKAGPMVGLTIGTSGAVYISVPFDVEVGAS